MSDHHHHHDHSGPIAIGATAARVVVGLLTGIGVLVLIGAFWLWPSHQHVDIPLPMQNGGGGAVQTEAGTVTMQDTGPCGSPSNGKVFDDTPQPPPNDTYTCARSLVTIDSGPHKGKHTLLEIAPGPGQPVLRTGDHIRMVGQNDPSGQLEYSFEDYSRGFPLLLIVVIFVAVVAVVARWRGLRAVLGLGFAFLVLVEFMLPALLEGKPALPVAVIAGALILYAVLYLAHGVNLRTSSALLGTLSAMLLATALSWLALKITHVTGLSQEDNTNVQTYVQHVSITGLLLAGFIIGSLGVLNDVTITQASAAFELAAIDEKSTRREIFAASMRVGRDHIASTVYTLVLAYAGGALPLLLMFSVAGRPLGDVITADAVAIEIARSAVGGICLALSVPLTTAIAVLLARPFSLTSREPEPAPARRRARGIETGAGERSARRRQDATARRALDKHRHAEPEEDANDEEDADYLRSLAREEYGPRRGAARRRGDPDRPGISRRARPADDQGAWRRTVDSHADQQPAEPYSNDQSAESSAAQHGSHGRIGSEPYPGDAPRSARGRLLDQLPPGRPGSAGAPTTADDDWPPANRPTTGPGHPATGHSTGEDPAVDWFAQSQPPPSRYSFGQAPASRHAAPYPDDTGDDYADRWSAQPYSGRHAGPDYPDQPSDQTYPGIDPDGPTRRQHRTENRRLPAQPDDTAGRRYRRDWPPTSYNE